MRNPFRESAEMPVEPKVREPRKPRKKSERMAFKAAWCGAVALLTPPVIGAIGGTAAGNIPLAIGAMVSIGAIGFVAAGVSVVAAREANDERGREEERARNGRE